MADEVDLSDEELAALTGHPIASTVNPSNINASTEETPLDRLAKIGTAYGKGAVSGAVHFVPNLLKTAMQAAKYVTTPTYEDYVQDEIQRHKLGLSKLDYTALKLKNAADITGHMVAQGLGGMAGATLGTAAEAGVPGPGTVLGAGAGASAGEAAYLNLKNYLLGGDLNAEEIARQSGEALAPGMLFGVGKEPILREKALTAAEEIPSKAIQAVKEKVTQDPEKVLADVGDLTRGVWPTEQLKQGVKQIKSDPLGTTYTTAEIIPTKEAKLLEHTLTATNPEFGANLAELKQAEEAGQKFVVEQEAASQYHPIEQAGPNVFGETKKLELQKGVEAIDNKLKEIYAPIDRKYTITKYGSLKRSANEITDMFGGDKLVPSDLKALRDTIVETPVKEGFSVGRLIQLRSTAGGLAARYGAEVGGKQAAAAASKIKNALTTLIEKTPTGADDWAAANEQAAPLMKLRDEGPLAGITQYKLTPEGVSRKVVKDVSSVRQYKSLTNESPEAMAALQGHFVRNMYLQTPANRVKFIKANRPLLNEVFNGDVSSFNSIVKKYEASQRVAKSITPRGGSQTAMLESLKTAYPDIGKLLTQNLIQRKLQAYKPTPSGGMLRNATAELTQWALKKANQLNLTPGEARRAVINEAALNPELALKARKAADKRGAALSQALQQKQ